MEQKTWADGTSADWSTGLFWNPQGVPTSSDDAFIGVSFSRNPFVVSVSSFQSASSVTVISSQATLTVGAGGSLSVINSLGAAAGGRLKLEAGGAISCAYTFMYGDGPSATVNGGTWTIAGTLALEDLFGSAQLLITGGSVTDALGDIGFGGPNVGEAIVTGGIWTSSRALTIETYGKLTVRSAGIVDAVLASVQGQVEVDSGGVLIATNSLSLGGHSTAVPGVVLIPIVTINGGAVAIGQELDLSGMINLIAGVLTVGSTTPDTAFDTAFSGIHIAAGGFLKAGQAAAGLIESAVRNDGAIEVAGALRITGLVTGTGHLSIDAGGAVEFGSAVANSTVINLIAGGAHTIKLDNPSSFTGVISGLFAGDAIDLVGVTIDSVSLAGGVAVIRPLDGPAFTLNLVALPPNAVLATASDGAGGTKLSIASTPPTIGHVFWRDGAGHTVAWLTDGTRYTGYSVLPVQPAQYQIAATADVNGDGAADILWRDPATGANQLWTVDAAGAVTGQAALPAQSPAFQLEGVGDVTGGRTQSLVWRNQATGATYLWALDASGAYAGYAALPKQAPNYQVAGLFDVNHDGAQDIVWTDPKTNAGVVWFLTAGQYAGYAVLPRQAAGFTLAGVGDLTGTGAASLVWRNPTSGADYLWTLDATGALASYGALPKAPASWTLAGVTDVNGDGTADLLWRLPDNSADVWTIRNGAYAGYLTLPRQQASYTTLKPDPIAAAPPSPGAFAQSIASFASSAAAASHAAAQSHAAAHAITLAAR